MQVFSKQETYYYFYFYFFKSRVTRNIFSNTRTPKSISPKTQFLKNRFPKLTNKYWIFTYIFNIIVLTLN